MQISPPPRILIADDQPDVLEALRLLLKGEGFQIETAGAPAAVLAIAREQDWSWWAGSRRSTPPSPWW
jgi:CheY-like chemotaxis protein